MDYKELADRLEKRYKANETGSTFVTLCSRRDVLNASTGITALLARAEAAERERDKAIRTIETIMGTQKYCALCKNVECKNSNAKEASCKPMWNGLEE